jgi:hypothetical protein
MKTTWHEGLEGMVKKVGGMRGHDKWAKTVRVVASCQHASMPSSNERKVE